MQIPTLLEIVGRIPAASTKSHAGFEGVVGVVSSTDLQPRLRVVVTAMREVGEGTPGGPVPVQEFHRGPRVGIGTSRDKDCCSKTIMCTTMCMLIHRGINL